MKRHRHERGGGNRRRGVVTVMVSVLLVALIGFAALTVDVGAMYNTRTDMQRTADAAALAAAAMLSDYGDDDPLDLARQAAATYTNNNKVLGKSLALDAGTDVIFGRANYDGNSNSYTFTPTNDIPDAVQVRVRQTSDSPNGPFTMMFASLFGKDHTDISAQAIAIMVPRDIALVADLSGSHNDDSELRSYQLTDVNMHEMWSQLPGGVDEIGGGLWDEANIAANHAAWIQPDGSIPQAAGPAWGFMQELGFGTTTINSSYDPNADSGLIRLAYNADWNDGTLEDYLFDQGYSASEVGALMSNDYDSSGAYKYRVAAALGLAVWNSGQPGGLWEQLGVPPGDTGNGNNWISSAELAWTETIFGNNLSASSDIWLDYINGYMKSSSTALYGANSSFRYQFGAKTFANYLLERRPTNDQTPEFADVSQQPMQAVKDAAEHMLVSVLTALQSDDQVSLEIYGTTARHEVDLTPNYTLVSDRLNSMQAAHYDSWTNMGGGLQRAIEELTGPRARNASRKVIILLTDGKANVNASGGYSTSGGKEFALAKAAEAAELGIRIFAVSVGVGADLDTMSEIADIGVGEHFHAEGSIEQYSDQLDVIFNTIGGRRPVELIQ